MNHAKPRSMLTPPAQRRTYSDSARSGTNRGSRTNELTTLSAVDSISIESKYFYLILSQSSQCTVNTFHSLKISWFVLVCQTTSVHPRSWVIFFCFFHHRWRRFVSIWRTCQNWNLITNTHIETVGTVGASGGLVYSWRAHFRMTQKDKKTAAHTHIALRVHTNSFFRLSPPSSAFSFRTAPPSGPLSPCPWIGPAAWHVSCEHLKKKKKGEREF